MILIFLINYIKTQSSKIRQIKPTIKYTRVYERQLDKLNISFDQEKTYQIQLLPNQTTEFMYQHMFQSSTNNNQKIWVSSLPKGIYDYRMKIVDLKSGKTLYKKQPKQNELYMFYLEFSGSEDISVQFYSNSIKQNENLSVGLMCENCNRDDNVNDNVLKESFEKLFRVHKVNQRIEKFQSNGSIFVNNFMEVMKGNSERIYGLGVMEGVFVVVMGLFQIHVVKNLIDKKKMFQFIINFSIKI